MTKRSMPPRFKALCSLWRAFADFCSICGVGGVANLGWGSFSYPQSSHWGRSCLTSRLRASPTTTPRVSYARRASGGGQAHSVKHALGSHVSLRIDHTSPPICSVSPDCEPAHPSRTARRSAETTCQKGTGLFWQVLSGQTSKPPRESCLPSRRSSSRKTK